MSLPLEEQTDEKVLSHWGAHGIVHPDVTEMSKGCIEELLDALEERAPNVLLSELRNARDRAIEEF